MWLRPEMNKRGGGFSTGEALRQQDKLDVIAKNGAYYYAVRDKYGFGYWLGIYEGNLEKPHRYGYGFDHLDEETAMKLVVLFNTTKNYEPILGIDYKPQKFQQIVVFKEKHGDRHFIVNTRQELEKVALKIVLERNDEGYWYDFSSKEPVEPKIKKEDAEKFGDNIANAITREWKDYEYSVKQYKKDKVLKDALEKIVKNKDGGLALQFLESMKDGEYEGFEVITGEEIEES
jgi:hypothetical protein